MAREEGVSAGKERWSLKGEKGGGFKHRRVPLNKEEKM